MTLLRVLIVEDDPFIASDLEGALSEAGCEVCGVAPSERVALKMADATRPAFAVVDVQLSPGDGRVVARELFRRYNTAVLMATAHCQESENLAATGAVACLPKPYPIEDVHAALRAMLDLKEGRTVSRLPHRMFVLNQAA